MSRQLSTSQCTVSSLGKAHQAQWLMTLLSCVHMQIASFASLWTNYLCLLGSAQAVLSYIHIYLTSTEVV